MIFFSEGKLEALRNGLWFLVTKKLYCEWKNFPNHVKNPFQGHVIFSHQQVFIILHTFWNFFMYIFNYGTELSAVIFGFQGFRMSHLKVIHRKTKIFHPKPTMLTGKDQTFSAETMHWVKLCACRILRAIDEIGLHFWPLLQH